MRFSSTTLNSKIRSALPFLAILLVYQGCFFTSDVQEVPTASNYTFELYMTRTSLTGTEFEQYKLLPMGLFAECGLIRRGRQVTNQQGVHTVSLAARNALGGVIAAIAERDASESTAGLPSPGNNSDMFDPGKFTLSAVVDGHPLSVKTSFDEVANGTSELSQALVRLAETTRGITENPPCKNMEFFGLMRRSTGSE